MAEDLGPGLNRAIWPLTLLALLFLGLRIYCKLWRRRSLWWDDYLLVASWIALAASSALQSVSVALGLGRDTQQISSEDIQRITMYSYIAGFFTLLSATWGKLSFALTLLRISNGWIRSIVWFILITVLLSMGGGAVIQLGQCWPIERLWDKSVRGSCLSSEVVQQYDLFMSVYSGTMDIALALLPWRILWHVQISKKEKYGALFAMGMGVFAGISSMVKIAALFAIGNPEMSTTVILFIFGTLEGAVTIMATSVPVLRALMQRSARPNAERTTTSQRSEQKEADL